MDFPTTFDESTWVPTFFSDFAQNTVGRYVIASTAIIILLVIAIVLMFVYYRKPTEAFNPTRTMRFQSRDGLGESFTPQRSDSYFATTGTVPVIDTSAPDAGQQVLASAEFDCQNNQLAHDDAWAWQMNVAAEPMVGRPKSDNDFSKILAGN